MRQFWELPNEEQSLNQLPETLVYLLLGLDTDAAAKLLLLLWRAWHVRNNLTRDDGKLSFAGSVKFLCRYREELCSIRHNGAAFDRKRKTRDSKYPQG
ncbi:hypothetical protein BAE44_0017187 [Dichanthelium oligosanthes]|uniref:Uncharacterized protein n=1 Tax=Dichanthelium oligosanthes TaxID=888268 RepID=A0A1E5V9G0_9POAL|nr:hypothetical protein BAE44_0017187 [Dichanthelium oligosanthes]